MKKSFRKVLGLLLSITMVASLLPNLAMAAETDGYYIKLEETDAKDRNSFGDVRTNEFFSGGQARSFGSKNVPSEDGHYIEFEVDIKKAGDYKIWVHGGRSGPDWSSPTKIVIDGTTTLSCTNGDVTSWSAKDYGINHALAFQYVDAKLTKGKHIIRYMINEVAPSNTSWYLGAFDFMLVVPANYSWTQSKTELPVAPEIDYIPFNEEGYLCLEAETDYSFKHTAWCNTLTDGITTDAVSGSGWGMSQPSAPGADGYNIDFDIDVAETGSYDIWVYGGRGIYAHVSEAKIRIDGEEINPQLAHYSNDNWGKQSGSAVNLGWAKSTVTLEEGEQTLSYYVDTVASESNSSYVGAIDLIYIVPSSYSYVPSGTGKTAAKPEKPAPVEPEEPEKNYIPFNEEGYLWLEAETDYAEKHSGWVTGLEDYHTKDAVSEGSGLAISQSVAPGATGYNVDFYIDVEEAGNYDIWVYGGKIGYDWISPGKIQIDGTDIAPQLAYYSRDDWGKLGNNGINLGWNKATVALEAGEQTLRYYINDDVASKAGTYQNGLDVICISPVDYGWTPAGTGKTAAKPEKPEELVPVSSAWIESDSLIDTNREAKETLEYWSNGSAWSFAQATAPEGGYYADYLVSMIEGNYDIYFRSSDNAYSGWMSDVALSVDGEAKEYASVLSDGWSRSGGHAVGWNKVSNVAMNGEHTVRFGIVASRVEGDPTYIGALDAIVIVPAGAPFAPVAGNIPATQADFELCTILKDIDLSNVKEDIELPEALEDGTEIVWTSSNTRVITNDGVVTRPVEEDVVVVLTATVGDATKDFAVTVKYVERFEVSDFVINGTAAAGETMTASATVKRNDGENGMINLILAVYNQDDQMVAVDICELAGTAEGTDYDCEVTIDSDEEGTLYAKAFLWTDFSKLEPIMSGISTLD